MVGVPNSLWLAMFFSPTIADFNFCFVLFYIYIYIYLYIYTHTLTHFPIQYLFSGHTIETATLSIWEITKLTVIFLIKFFFFFFYTSK